MTNPKLGPDAVTTDKIKNGEVDTVDLRDGAVTGSKVADGAITGAKAADGTIGLADLATVSGDVDVDPAPLAANTCRIETAAATGIRVGDRPIFQVPADLEDGLIAEPVVADTNDVLRFRLCNTKESAADIDSASRSYGYLVLR